MRTSLFITKEKPENTSAGWKFDEGDKDFYYIRDIDDSVDLREGDHVSIDNKKFVISTRIYSVEENIFTYFLDPIFKLNV